MPSHALNARLEAAPQTYNTCLGEALRRARLLRERWAYHEARWLLKDEEGTGAFRAARRSVELVRLSQRVFRDRLGAGAARYGTCRRNR